MREGKHEHINAYKKQMDKVQQLVLFKEENVLVG